MTTLLRSWKLTKLTFSIINRDKELLVFTLLSFVFSTVLTAALILPALIPLVAHPDWSPETVTLVQVAAVLAIYFALALVATFFNVCVVYTTKVRLEGGNATFGQSLAFAGSRLGSIAAWSLVAATVGLVLRILHEAGRRTGKFGSFLTDLLVGLVGAAWSIVTLFVVPVLVYENTGPFKAIGRSVDVIRQTWGESLVKGVGLGLVQFLLQVVVVFAALGTAVLLFPSGGWTAVAVCAALGAVVFLLVLLLFSAASTVFNTALYAYAQTGQIGGGYHQDDLAGAIRRAQP